MAEVVRTDYDGDTAYATFGFDATNQLVRRESWEPGLARVQQPSFPTATADYLHADHLGTTRHMSVSGGDAFEPAAYTAFGEKVSGVDFARFGYAGAWGYQTHADLPFLHVGARYYDPAAGRFLQRDPNGIADTPNVYAYVGAAPTHSVDPTGEWIGHAIRVGIKVGSKVAKPMWRGAKACARWTKDKATKSWKWLKDKFRDTEPPPPPPFDANELPEEPPDFDWDKEGPGPEDIDDDLVLCHV